MFILDPFAHPLLMVFVLLLSGASLTLMGLRDRASYPKTHKMALMGISGSLVLLWLMMLTILAMPALPIPSAGAVFLMTTLLLFLAGIFQTTEFAEI